MPLAYNVNNFMYGKGRLFFKLEGETGYLDLGNVPKFELEPILEKLEHFSSRSGMDEKVLDLVKQKKLTSSLDLEEYSAENLNIIFLGDGVQAGSQIVGFVDGETITLIDDRFVEVESGKFNMTFHKVKHGTVTDGPFVAGETITGGSSAATAQVAWVGTNELECVNVSGTFDVDEIITGGTSTATATVTGTEDLEDGVVVDDAATPTTRYVLGTDYSFDGKGGLIRKLSTGSIPAQVADVSCNYPAKTTKSVRGLTNSQVKGSILFVGDPDQGPQLRIEIWSASITVGGSIGFITTEVASIPMTVEVLSMSELHPSEPFFRLTEIS